MKDEAKTKKQLIEELTRCSPPDRGRPRQAGEASAACGRKGGLGVPGEPAAGDGQVAEVLPRHT